MPQVSLNRPAVLLVVDDDLDDLKLTEHHLNKYDCITTLIADQDQALRIVAENWYDYAFIDLWLVGMTGVQFVREAKPKNVQINWFIMSGDFSGTKGSRALLEIQSVGAKPVVKGGLPRAHDRLKTLDQIFSWYLTLKRVKPK